MQLNWVDQVEQCTPVITPDLESYSKIILMFSGGKDSLACLLHLIDLGLADKIELWHHDVDGRTGRLNRVVDHWRPVHKWLEADIWAIIKRHRVNPHPAYKLGWGRVSCAACIFGSARQWASLAEVNIEQFNKIAGYEHGFGVTIQRGLSVTQLARNGHPYTSINRERIFEALNPRWNEPVFLENWTLPAGAFGESDGPV